MTAARIAPDDAAAGDIAEADLDRRWPGRTRMCALTRAVRPEADLIRFVAAPDGAVVADIKAKLPGRGVWLGLDRRLVAEAMRKNVFSRGLKQPAWPAADLPDQIAARLREAALGRLGLARKAGAVLTGFAKVEAAIAHGGLAAIVAAADAAPDGRRKMDQVRHRHRHCGAGSAVVVGLFDAAELSLATGSPHVIHAAVLQSPAGKSFVEAVARLQRYEGVDDREATGTADASAGRNL